MIELIRESASVDALIVCCFIRFAFCIPICFHLLQYLNEDGWFASVLVGQSRLDAEHILRKPLLLIKSCLRFVNGQCVFSS